MDLVLVRYAEMGLKSRAVRKRFESILVDNMMTALAAAGVEGLVTTEHGRIFVEASDQEKAVRALSRVFGVASVSPTVSCASGMEEMKLAISAFSLPLFKGGEGFAVRARRTGEHPFTSMDLGRELGSAIFLANHEKGVRVDLTSPDVEVFVEVRGRRAYIFSTYVPGPGGLPLGSQGKVVALVEGERDALAAWLVMKRGCRIIALGEEGSPGVRLLRAWDPGMKVMARENMAEAVSKNRALALVFGYSLQEFEAIRSVDATVPAFFPLVGMGEDEISKRLEGIGAA
jgi:thiamine biosynthesis protein ThiI